MATAHNPGVKDPVRIFRSAKRYGDRNAEMFPAVLMIPTPLRQPTGDDTLLRNRDR